MCYEEKILTAYYVELCYIAWTLPLFDYLIRKKIECNNCVSRESMLVYQLGFGRWFWFCVSDKIVILSFFVKWYIWYIFRLETYFNEPFSKYTMLFFLLEQHYFIIKYILTVPTWVLSRTILSCINFQIVNFSTFIIGIWTLKHIIPQSFCKYWNDWNISSDQQYQLKWVSLCKSSYPWFESLQMLGKCVAE